MTRQEHLDWCKQRALAYLPDDPNQAFMSMASDLEKHEETANHIGMTIGIGLTMVGKLTPADMERFIKGFN